MNLGVRRPPAREHEQHRRDLGLHDLAPLRDVSSRRQETHLERLVPAEERGLQSGVITNDQVTGATAAACSRLSPMAVSTCEGSTAPLEQAAPLDTAKPLRSSATTMASPSTPPPGPTFERPRARNSVTNSEVTPADGGPAVRRSIPAASQPVGRPDVAGRGHKIHLEFWNRLESEGRLVST